MEAKFPQIFAFFSALQQDSGHNASRMTTTLTKIGSSLWKYSFLGGYHTLVEAWGVWVGQIRRLLVWLIEHFPSAAGIFPIFLDQLRD